MEYRTDELLRVSNRLFSQKSSLNTLWQEIAENFYPERAEFTVERDPGDEFADHLTTSYPIMARRDLGNLFGSMLRPIDKEWFRMGVTGYDVSDDVEGQQFLQWATKLMRNAMYDNESGFIRATKEGDHDYAAFGQCAISTQMNWDKMALLYRSHHLRDMAWAESVNGMIERTDLDWKPTIRDLVRQFGKNNDPKIIEQYEDKNGDMYRQVTCRHIVLPSENYESSYKESDTSGYKRYPQPYVSIYIDVENDKIIEETGSWTKIYTIPRWQTVSGSQYSYSPATVAALPDARLYQSIALTLLEAGEKYTNPPMLATKEAIRGDVNIFAGGITWVDSQYDERLGEVLRPIAQDRGSIGVGFEMQEQIKRALHEAFFLNRVNLPDRGSAEMTAYEASQRVQEYIRDALPIFEPTTPEYNGSICDITYETLYRAGAFGPPEMVPAQLQGADIEFKFESPLQAAEERLKGQKFMGAISLISQAMGIDPTATDVLKVKDSLRDAVIGSGTPADWLNTPEELAMMEAARAEQQQMQDLMQSIGQGAEVAKTVGEAGQALTGMADEGEILEGQNL